jgi:hypothetical protein
MELHLTTDSYVLLLTTVPHESEAFAALTRARKIYGGTSADEFSVQCSAADAKLYLAATRGRDPERSAQIERELQRSAHYRAI